MMELVQSITILLLALGVIANALATRKLLKALHAMGEVQRALLFLFAVR
jgi:hypothetical protein